MMWITDVTRRKQLQTDDNAENSINVSMHDCILHEHLLSRHLIHIFVYCNILSTQLSLCVIVSFF